MEFSSQVGVNFFLYYILCSRKIKNQQILKAEKANLATTLKSRSIFLACPCSHVWLSEKRVLKLISATSRKNISFVSLALKNLNFSSVCPEKVKKIYRKFCFFRDFWLRFYNGHSLPPGTKLRQGKLLHLSVILFTGGGVSVHVRGGSVGGLCPGWGSLSRVEGLCQGWGSLSRVGVSAQGGGLCPGWGSLSRGSLSRGLCLGGLCLGGICLGGSLSRGVSV